jgi:hypothetical protein
MKSGNEYRCKKKELIWNFYREGKVLCNKVIKTNDHDFESYAEGKIVPHGIYDVKDNSGYITLWTSKDTSELSCDSLYEWWDTRWKKEYINATSILLLMDWWGSNASNSYLFKNDIQNLVNKIRIPIRIAHYPPYTSKYNPIEHRLFCHINRTCEWVIFSDVEVVHETYLKTKTSTGLSVDVRVNNKTYETWRKLNKETKKSIKEKIKFDDKLSKWNYTIFPEQLG